MSDMHNSPYGNHANNRPSMAYNAPGSSDNLMSPSHMSFSGSTPNLLGGGPNRSRSPMGFGGPANNRASAMSRPMSNVNFMDGPSKGPTDAEIQSAVVQILGGVDLDAMSKKQLKALVEQKLQTQLQGERRNFLDKCIDEELSAMEL